MPTYAGEIRAPRSRTATPLGFLITRPTEDEARQCVRMLIDEPDDHVRLWRL